MRCTVDADAAQRAQQVLLSEGVICLRSAQLTFTESAAQLYEDTPWQSDVEVEDVMKAKDASPEGRH